MAELAVDLAVDNPAPGTNKVFPTSLTIRQTTGPAPS
jgi:hypothetical protein